MGSGQVFDFGLRLRKLRENKHLSQEELGKRVGVTKGSIYRYENNVQSPSLETARKLAVVLGTTLDNLAGLEDGVVIRLPNLSEAEELPCVSLSVDSFPETLTTDLCGCVFGCREQRPGSRN